MLAYAGFDWDEGNRTKCQKHGVSIDEIEALFAASPGVAPDLQHSAAECTRRKLCDMPRRVPRLTSDEEAEAFLEQDLSELDFSQFKPVRFERQPKTDRVNMRLPAALLDAVKAKAAREGMPYQRFIRQVLEEAVMRGG